MALSRVVIGSGTFTTNGQQVTFTPVVGRVYYFLFAVAVQGGGATLDTTRVAFDVGTTGLSVSAISANPCQVYGGRRGVLAYRGTAASPANGTVTMTAENFNSGSVFGALSFWIVEYAGIDTATPNDAVVQAADATGASPLDLADVGTIDPGDEVLIAVGHENAANSLAVTGATELFAGGEADHIRSFSVFALTSDDTPSVTWGSDGGTAAIAFIVNVAAGGGGTQHDEGVAGTVSAAGAVGKQARKSFSGALSVAADVSGARTVMQVLAGVLATTATIALNTARTVAGTVGPGGAVLRACRRSLAGALVSAGTTSKRLQRSLVGVLGIEGPINGFKQMLVDLAGTLSSEGGVSKMRAKLLEAALSSAGALAKRGQKALAGSFGTAGDVGRAARKALAGAVASAGGVLRRTSRSVTGSLSIAGTAAGLRLGQLFEQVVGGTLSAAGAVARTTVKPLAASWSAVGALSRRTARSLAGAWSAAGSIASSLTGGGGAEYFQSLAGALAPSGSPSRRTARALTAALAATSTRARAVVRAVAGSLAVAGQVSGARAVLVALAGALTAAGTVSKHTATALTGALGPAGTVIKLMQRALTGVFTLAGLLGSQKRRGDLPDSPEPRIWRVRRVNRTWRIARRTTS